MAVLNQISIHCFLGAGWVLTEMSTIDQIVLIVQNIKDSFEAKKKAHAIFLNLTAAYHTVWHCSLN